MVRCPRPRFFQASKTSYLTLLFPISLAVLFARVSFSASLSLLFIFLSVAPFLFKSSRQTPNTALKEPPATENDSPRPSSDETSPDDTEDRYNSSPNFYNKTRVERVEWSEDEGSISEEDGLIEIPIPSGHFVIDSPAGPVFFDDLKLFSGHRDNLSMGDEDNLIEIDIYMGSIKSSKFDIYQK